MRRTSHFLIATMILAAPMPVAAQVTVDPNALNALGGSALPEPPRAFSGEAHRSYHHRRRHLARAEHGHKRATAVASNGEAKPNAAATGGVVLEHPKTLGPSFTSLPPLPQAPPPLPPSPPVLATVAPKAKPAAPKVETAQAAPAPKPNPAPAPIPPTLALPAAAPPLPPARLAEATPAPPAAVSNSAPPARDGLPKGADLLTLPFFVQESDLPAAETAMLRDFARRYGPAAQYVVRAYASAPPGDDDPSTPRRLSLARAQSVAAALFDSGAAPDQVRLLALGAAGGTPANRVEVIAMPPSSGHTASPSSP